MLMVGLLRCPHVYRTVLTRLSLSEANTVRLMVRGGSPNILPLGAAEVMTQLLKDKAHNQKNLNGMVWAPWSSATFLCVFPSFRPRPLRQASV